MGEIIKSDKSLNSRIGKSTLINLGLDLLFNDLKTGDIAKTTYKVLSMKNNEVD